METEYQNSKKGIFLIEDDLAIIDVYSAAFTGAGISFKVMTSGKQAMEKINNIHEGKEAKPALVLLDLMLPDINGLELLFKLRNHNTTKDVKVFILSNYSSDALLGIKYIKPDKFILKSSITPTDLIKLVQENIT